WQKPGQQNVAQELIKIIINYVAELRVIFEPASGDISSLAVAKDYRRKGIGKSLLKSAVSHFQSDVLKFTNVDCDCESVTGFLSSLGLTPKGQQFEMVRKI
ncbi:GNAT family N-acetyltransferase, partial [Bacteroides nordii]|uniref:GNAT family N-acetyltransferase n=1 Tax=Bacteroides nordii TaxID=291645 RepID=UPI001E40C0A4